MQGCIEMHTYSKCRLMGLCGKDYICKCARKTKIVEKEKKISETEERKGAMTQDVATEPSACNKSPDYLHSSP